VESLRDPGFLSAREHGNSGLWNFWNPGNMEINRERRQESGRVKRCGYSNLNSDVVLQIQETYILMVQRTRTRYVRNFLFLTCSTRTHTLRLPQTTPHTITTSHTNGKPSLIIPPLLPPHSFSNNYHYNHRISPFVMTNQPQSLQHNVPNNQYLKGSTPT